MPSILLIEDNLMQRKAIAEFLNLQKIKGQGLIVWEASDLASASSLLKNKRIDLVLSDLKLPDGEGSSLIKETHQIDPKVPFLLLTGEPSIETAVDAIQKGAHDYLLKPVDLVHLKKKVVSLLETASLRVENQNLRHRLDENFATEGFIGKSSVLRELIEKVKQIASVDVTVTLEGESGTGKEMIANLIHQSSSRSSQAFIKVNCGALTKTLLESELFGSSKGAYTGADRDREGYFEAANGGTIFLDEIGEMEPESQVRLLRVLEERHVIRVGSTKPIPVDIRIIAATNKQILDEVEKELFREDLYYRLAVVKLSLPSLREHAEDIPLLFNHFITSFNEKYGKSVRGISKELTSFFQRYHWPGNVREFRNVLEGMVILASDDILQVHDLPLELARPSKSQPKGRKLLKNIIPGHSWKDYELVILQRNLQFFQGNREQTAESLGISERTLYRKIR